ncbi:proton-conducting transporter transmembrane domain-containing protein [Athalassotoga saccharophila]|uniref:proton-conducting transporter transmembrane domain-containing protein n=1 Tax=Athalassotoga saccharophila TaxID=1441386 RepID=UPI00137AAE1C|nr:proton-conducting transporter membrane subunit [Athalassotoga saccharophila]BBJ28702.1 Na(+)/H(+) antiporter subunit D [Athalassotoga saccharophila]
MKTYNIAALLVGVPLLMAFSIPLFGFISKQLAKWITVLTLGFEFFFALYIFLWHIYPFNVIMGNWVPPFGENLYIGPFATVLIILVSFVGLMISIYNLWSANHGDVVHFALLFLMFVGGSIGLISTGDIFNIFIFMEITGISSYALAAYGPERRALGGAFKYLVVSSIGSTLYLFGVLLIYTQLGTLNIAEIAARISQTTSGLLTFAGILLVAGLAVEAELFPFNGWVPDTYTGAVNPVSATLSGIGSVGGVYVLFRILMTVFGKDGNFVSTYGNIDLMSLVAILGSATVVIGELSALAQKNVKKMLAYSSMAQMGLVAIGFSIGSKMGSYAGVFQLVNHSVAKAMMFLILGVIVSFGIGERIDDMKGLWYKSPFLTITFTIGSLSLLGLPLFGGFWSKFALVDASIQRGGWYDFVIAIVLFASVVEAFYYLRIVGYMFTSKPISTDKIKVSVSPAVPIVAFSILIIAIGVFPQIVGGISWNAAHELTDKMGGYVLNVIPTIVGH